MLRTIDMMRGRRGRLLEWQAEADETENYTYAIAL